MNKFDLKINFLNQCEQSCWKTHTIYTPGGSGAFILIPTVLKICFYKLKLISLAKQFSNQEPNQGYFLNLHGPGNLKKSSFLLLVVVKLTNCQMFFIDHHLVYITRSISMVSKPFILKFLLLINLFKKVFPTEFVAPDQGILQGNLWCATAKHKWGESKPLVPFHSNTKVGVDAQTM